MASRDGTRSFAVSRDAGCDVCAEASALLPTAIFAPSSTAAARFCGGRGCPALVFFSRGGGFLDEVCAIAVCRPRGVVVRSGTARQGSIPIAVVDQAKADIFLTIYIYIHTRLAAHDT
jgi:hypothetical protein